MDNPIIKKSIIIKASADKAWRVFADPEITKQMGGKYLTEWIVGGFFGWQSLDGTLRTSGKILEFERGKFLKHQLFDLNDENILLSVITYELKEDRDETIILATEQINYQMTDEQLNDTNAGWDIALQLIKDIAEKL